MNTRVVLSCLLLCWFSCPSVNSTPTGVEGQVAALKKDLVQFSVKLDREMTVHQQNNKQMSTILEHISKLLIRLEVCGSTDAPPSTATPPPSPSTATPPPSPSTATPPPSPVVVDDSWRDEVAQGACSGLQNAQGWMFAVRRDCLGGRTCTDICNSLLGQDSQVNRMSCVDSLNVYKGSHPLERELAASDVETLGTKVYRYFSCSQRNCGPNFCCCEGQY